MKIPNSQTFSQSENKNPNRKADRPEIDSKLQQAEHRHGASEVATCAHQEKKAQTRFDFAHWPRVSPFKYKAREATAGSFNFRVARDSALVKKSKLLALYRFSYGAEGSPG